MNFLCFSSLESLDPDSEGVQRPELCNKEDRTAREILCLGHKEEERSPLWVRRMGETPWVRFCCLFHSVSSQCQAILMQQQWWWQQQLGRPLKSNQGTQVLRPWEEFPLNFFFSLLILPLLEFWCRCNIMEKLWETCNSVGKWKPCGGDYRVERE